MTQPWRPQNKKKKKKEKGVGVKGAFERRDAIIGKEMDVVTSVHHEVVGEHTPLGLPWRRSTHICFFPADELIPMILIHIQYAYFKNIYIHAVRTTRAETKRRGPWPSVK